MTELLARRMPKVHLHCHLEGSLRPQTFVELARHHGVRLRYRPDGGPGVPEPDESSPYRCADFREFLYAFAAVSRALAQPEDYARLAREFVADALAQHVMYAELFVSPSVWTFFHPELDVRKAMAAIVAELRSARPHADFSLIVDLTRNFGPERAMQTARLAASLVDLDVIGIGLGGDETNFPANLFGEAFAWARSTGLNVVAHAGEAAGADSVRDAVEVLGAQRIGHGTAALGDPNVLALLAQRRIPVEVCPTSNAVTGAAPLERQTYAEFDRAGCIVTIDADDPAMFGASITDEYERVERTCGAKMLERFVANAIDASFANAAHKEALRERLFAELAGVRRTESQRVGS